MDMEARAHADHHDALRLWLRMLTCTQLVEQRVRSNLREQFETTLPRFDLMAQLERAPDGLKMNELSRRMMVTGGNVTGITDQLEAENMVQRLPVEGDRRALLIRLTPTGRKAFAEMAEAHERWIIEALSGLNQREVQSLHTLLGKVKQRINSQESTNA
ncbi:MAG TPA: MarR family transcriptional regulator [Casimicrobium sp.]|jgi:DNA-binding MarR family transcriptional regulator|nr:MarR family transcriptional regulator [Burkholderiales bacterium]HPT56699.1 MarR family transcriptional regulator [Casimicrobium sp.]